MDEHIFIGTHIISEMYGVSDHLINDQSLILKILLRGVKLCGAKCEGVLCKQFLPSGFSAVLLPHTSQVPLCPVSVMSALSY